MEDEAAEAEQVAFFVQILETSSQYVLTSRVAFTPLVSTYEPYGALQAAPPSYVAQLNLNLVSFPCWGTIAICQSYCDYLVGKLSISAVNLSE